MKLKTILRISSWFIAISGITALLGFSVSEIKTRPCSKVDIIIAGNDEHQFIETNDIQTLLSEKNKCFTGMPLSLIKTDELEKMFNSHTHIANAEVSKSIDGVLEIEIQPKRPIARFINAYGESFYLDDQGTMMQWSDNYTARLPVFTGQIYDRYANGYMLNYATADINDSMLIKNNLYTLYQFAAFLDSNEFWKAQIEQIYVGEKIELIPRAGNQVIVLGDLSGFREKLDRLMIFYREAMPKVGWETYKLINLEYKGQVIGTRAETKPKSKNKTAIKSAT